ncbi:amino acid permease [Mycolicibacterium iranicum]|uniref:Amino acid permease n=1 Tax=Mycolicibacterium iranicum TaxID=912594 RepID=A0A1X1WRD2_MYCIR|nr:amino acid permease [Mycolicibacterium iranicum]MCZ0731306.1 amino acid permease [Mycolicibacterium iranicum]ORV89206.1 amino acid permease [Mycolicibacterium iranicum]
MSDQSSRSDSAELAQFGYTQSLERRTGKFASFAVAFAFVSIATGIFTTYGAVLNSSGPAGIWTWPIAVVGQLAVAFVLGALAARIPVTGYHYQWMSRLANPILGWIIGWISFTFLAIVVVAVDYTIASTILPVLLNYESTATIAWIMTAAVLTGQALLVAFSTPWAERVNNSLVTLELIGMAALTVLLLVVAALRGDMDLSNLFSTGAIPSEGYWSFGDLTSAGPWMLGFLLGAFTIVGFESAANLAEETHDPERVVPRAMWQAVLASGVLGFLFIVAVTLAAGDPVVLAESGTPIADVINRTLGSAVGTLLLLMVVLAIFACGLVIMITGVRVTWAMSRDQRFPGWQQWNQISPKFHTPLKATLLYFVLAQLILAVFAHSETALFTLFGAATLLPAVMYASTVVLYLVKRKTLPVSSKFDLGAWEIPVLAIAVIWLAFELALFRDAAFKQAWLYVLVMVAIGAAYLAYLLVRRGKQGLSMPDMHSIDAELRE